MHLIKMIAPGGISKYLQRGKALTWEENPCNIYQYKSKQGASRALKYWRNKKFGFFHAMSFHTPPHVVSAKEEIAYWKDIQLIAYRKDRRCPRCSCRERLGHYTGCPSRKRKTKIMPKFDVSEATDRVVQAMFGDHGPFGFNADSKCPATIELFYSKKDGGMLKTDIERIQAARLLITKLESTLTEKILT